MKKEQTILLSANWCSNCQPVKHHIKCNELDVKILDVDTPEGNMVAMKYSVRGLPTLIKDGVTYVGQEKIMEVIGV